MAAMEEIQHLTEASLHLAVRVEVPAGSHNFCKTVVDIQSSREMRPRRGNCNRQETSWRICLGPAAPEEETLALRERPSVMASQELDLR
jgi:hypothetical protein